MNEHQKGSETELGSERGSDQGSGTALEGPDTDPGADCGAGSMRGLGESGAREAARQLLKEEWDALDQRKRDLQRKRDRLGKEGQPTKLTDRMISSVHRRRNEVSGLLRGLDGSDS